MMGSFSKFMYEYCMRSLGNSHPVIMLAPIDQFVSQLTGGPCGMFAQVDADLAARNLTR